MADRRIAQPRGERMTLTFDGQEVEAFAGETVGMALWAAGILALRPSSRDGTPRGMFCAMGICYECLVDVDGSPVRACMLPASQGMVVTSRGGGR